MKSKVNDIRTTFVYKYLNRKFDVPADGSTYIVLDGVAFEADDDKIFYDTRVSPDEPLYGDDVRQDIYKMTDSLYKDCFNILCDMPEKNTVSPGSFRYAIMYIDNRTNLYYYGFDMRYIQFFIQKNTLHVYVNMSSCDAVVNYRFCYAIVKDIAERMLRELNVYWETKQNGRYLYDIDIVFFVGNLFIRDYDYDSIQEYISRHSEISEERMRQMEDELRDEINRSLDSVKNESEEG